MTSPIFGRDALPPLVGGVPAGHDHATTPRLGWPRRPNDRRDSEDREQRGRRWQSRRSRLAAGGPAHRFLTVSALRPAPRPRLYRGAGLVLVDRDLLRHS